MRAYFLLSFLFLIFLSGCGLIGRGRESYEKQFTSRALVKFGTDQNIRDYAFDLYSDSLPGINVAATPTGVAAPTDAVIAADAVTPAFAVIPAVMVTPAVAADPTNGGGNNNGAADTAEATAPPKPPAYETILMETDADKQKQLRNRLQNYLITVSDQKCELHKASIYADSAGINFGAGTLTSLLSGAATIVTPATASNILSGAATFTNASRSQLNEAFFQNLLGAAIIKSIDASRDAFAAEIKQRQTDFFSNYSLDEAVKDAQIYHQKCSFFNGVVQLTKAAEKIPTSSQNISEKIDLLIIRMKENDRQKAGSDPKTAQRLEDLNNVLEQKIKLLSDQLAK